MFRFRRRGVKDEITFMDLDELRELGILQEVNRRVFHPLGLCLAVRIDPKTNRSRDELKIIDHRDDPEGVVFAPGVASRWKRVIFDRLWNERVNRRIELIGFVEQPIPAGWAEFTEMRVRVEKAWEVAEEKGVTVDTGKIETPPVEPPPPDDEPDPELVEAIRENVLSYARQEMNLESGDLPYRLARQLKIDGVV